MGCVAGCSEFFLPVLSSILIIVHCASSSSSSTASYSFIMSSAFIVKSPTLLSSVSYSGAHDGGHEQLFGGLVLTFPCCWNCENSVRNLCAKFNLDFISAPDWVSFLFYLFSSGFDLKTVQCHFCRI